MNLEVIDPVRIGILGLGTAGRTAVTSSLASPHCDVVAVCDLNLDTAREAAESVGARAYSQIHELCADGNVEAVYVATPTYLHLAHSLQLTAAGKHLMLEKPVVKDSAEAEALTLLQRDSGVLVMAVNTRGRDAPIRAMARVVQSGAIGRVLSLTNVSYTNWVIRPRFPYELIPALGGGVAFRQAPHQVEIARTIINEPIIAVTALAGSSPSPVDTVGNYSALVEFEGGASSTLVYNGYGYFDTAELTYGRGETGLPYDHDASTRMRKSKSWALDKYGTSGLALRDRGKPSDGYFSARRWGFVGLTIVSGECGDLRQSENGIIVYDEDGSHEVDCSADTGGLSVDFEEFYDALRLGKTLQHDGSWGSVTVRVCEALWTSHCDRRRITL